MKTKLLRVLAVMAGTCPFVAFAASEAQRDVLAADSAFAALSVERGTQHAFQAFLASDGIIFRPTAVPGHEWLATHEEASGRLEWRAAAAAVDCTGQLAATTGPWDYDNAEGGEPASGHYLSLWRRDADGEWSVVLDHGIDHAPGLGPSVDLQRGLDALWPGTVPRSCPKRSNASAAGLATADRKLNAAIRAKGIDAALRRFSQVDAVAYRDDSPPRLLAADWPADGPALGVRVEGRTRAVIAAKGSDMGYTYGEIVPRAGHRDVRKGLAVYVRLWRHDGREWRLGLDALTRLPDGAGP